MGQYAMKYLLEDTGHFLRRNLNVFSNIGFIVALLASLLGILLILSSFAGIYWVIVNKGTLTFLFGSLIFLILLITLAAAVNITLRRMKYLARTWLAFAAVLLVLAAYVIGGYSALITPREHVDMQRAQGRVYKLAAKQVFIDFTYELYECGPSGVFCTRVYQSRDYPTPDAYLDYNAATSEMQIFYDNLPIYSHPIGR